MAGRMVLPEADDYPGKQQIWVFSDPKLLIASNTIEITVQEAVRDDFLLALHAELQLSLELEQRLPKAIFYHCGEYLISNKKFNRGKK